VVVEVVAAATVVAGPVGPRDQEAADGAAQDQPAEGGGDGGAPAQSE